MDKAYIKKKNKQNGNLPSAVLKGVTAAIISGTLIILIFAFLSLRFDDPISMAPIFGVSTLLLSSLIGGYIGARSLGEKGFFCGIMTGLAFILILALAALLSGSVIKTPMFSMIAPISVLISSLGGMIGAGKKKPRKRRKSF